MALVLLLLRASSALHLPLVPNFWNGCSLLLALLEVGCV